MDDMDKLAVEILLHKAVARLDEMELALNNYYQQHGNHVFGECGCFACCNARRALRIKPTENTCPPSSS